MGDCSSPRFMSFSFLLMGLAGSKVSDLRNKVPDFLATTLFLANIEEFADDPDMCGSLSGVGLGNGGRVVEADFIAARGGIMVFVRLAKGSSSSESLMTWLRLLWIRVCARVMGGD